jgi:hypothetical protein
MYETGLVNVSIKDEAGHKIDGDGFSRTVPDAKV